MRNLFRRRDRRPVAIVRQFDNDSRWLLVDKKTAMPIGGRDYATAETAAWDAERRGYRAVLRSR